MTINLSTLLFHFDNKERVHFLEWIMDKEKIEFLKQNREIVYSLTLGKLVSMRQNQYKSHCIFSFNASFFAKNHKSLSQDIYFFRQSANVILVLQ